MLAIPHLKQNVMLAPYTTYQIGGPADYFVEVKNSGALVQAVSKAREAKLPYFILGCGANILIRDKGIRGLVIRNGAEGIEWLTDNRLRAESGAVIAQMIEATRDKALSGLEHFVGIPSSVGGAVWQNLHFLSPDRQRTLYIEEIVLSSRVFDKDNTIHTVPKDFFQFGYDDSVLHHEEIIVLDVTFQLTPKPQDEITAQMAANMEWRNAKQPQLAEFPSCGSVFKKIESVGAGRLIDQVGLKGTVIGKAQISPKHANYIVNLGGATASDVIDLIKLVQLEVKRKLGYDLEPEISIIGEK